MKIEVSAQTDIGIKREHNEDYILVSHKLNLFIVCDGMGGHNAGEIASSLTAKLVEKYLLKHFSHIESYQASPSNQGLSLVKDLVKKAINHACLEVYQEGIKDPDKKGMGTTLVLALVINEVAIIAHVGDSRVYLTRGIQEIQVTEDHSFVNEMVKEGVLSVEQAQNHPSANVITRAIGIQKFTRADVISIELMKGDLLILCSDGLSGYLKTGELSNLKDEIELKDFSQELIKLANARGGKDNISAISVYFGSDGSPPTHPNSISAFEKERVIKDIPLFRKFNFGEIAELIEIIEVRSFNAGDYLIVEKTPGKEMFIIARGEVDVLNQNNFIATLGKGAFFGEMSLIDNQGRNASIVAKNPTLTIVINRDPLFALFKRNNKLAVKVLWSLLQNMNRRLRSNDEKLFELQNYFRDLDPEISDELKRLELT